MGDLGSVGVRLIKDVQSVSLNGDVYDKNDADKSDPENMDKVPRDLNPLFIDKEEKNKKEKVKNKHFIILQHEGNQDINNKIETEKALYSDIKSNIGPRIYLDEDDPEWADIDIDEPDD